MKCFHIKQGVIVPGLPVDHKLTRPSVVFDGRVMRLSDDYLTRTRQLTRVIEADLVIDQQRLFTLEPESDDSRGEALVLLTTRQSTGGINISLDGIVGTDQILYHKNTDQAVVKLQGDMVRFNTSTALIRLLPGQKLTVHATFSKRIKLPFTWSPKEWVERWRAGPQYHYSTIVQESYIFDGSTVKSEFEELGKKVVAMVFGE